MIKTVRVVNDRKVDTTLTLREVSNGVMIREITGLGPVKADLRTTQKTLTRGMHYDGNSRGSRNLVITLELAEEPNRSIETIRRGIYTCFPVGEKIFLEIETSDNVRVDTYGVVESVEPEVFSDVPSIQVSIICVDPAFHGDVQSYTVQDSAGVDVVYKGSIDTGVLIEIVASPSLISGSTGGIYFWQRSPDFDENRMFIIYDSEIEIATGLPLTANDRIVINTSPGSKSAVLTRNGQTFNIFPALRREGDLFLTEQMWPRLRPEVPTKFVYTHASDAFGKYDVTVSWVELIEGI